MAKYISWIGILFIIFSTGCTNSSSTLGSPPTISADLQPSLPATLAVSQPTIAVSPTPTNQPVLHPMSIPAMRAGEYPGSEIYIERELDRGLNYRRYYAYYYSDELKIFGLLTIPESPMPSIGWPAIVFNHGYIPPDDYRTTERYVNYVDQLATNGYIVFRIDYRGHDRSEGVARGAYGDPGYEIDVLNAIASIKKHPSVNPDRIGLWGHSMGGYLSLRAMVITKDVRAGVIWAGVVASYPEMLYNWRRTGPFTASPSSRGGGWRDAWITEYGTPEQNPEFWNSVSATNYLGDLSGPLQLHHGTADKDVPLEFSIRLAELARFAGKPADLYTYEGDNHNISKYFSLAMDRTIAFYDDYLK